MRHQGLSTILFAIGPIVSILLGFSPKFGALILSIPPAVISGLSVVLFGLIAAMGGRIWVENAVYFASPRKPDDRWSGAHGRRHRPHAQFGDFTTGERAPHLRRHHPLSNPDPEQHGRMTRCG